MDVRASAKRTAADSIVPDGARVIAGRYVLQGMLGAGGMGTVYRARDLQLDEVVAIKLLKGDMSSEAGIVERFRREVKLARRVTHRNVARAYDIGQDDGEFFLTMELVEGESLGRLLGREGRLPVSRVLRIVHAVCAGLSAAHDAGVIHRDLKPDNVIVSEERVVVTDFGIARAAEAGLTNRTTGLLLGTPSYMAPEQVECAPDIDARADIYALGVMLFELFTGTLPFRGESAYAVAGARLHKPPPDPRTLGAPEAVASVILRCLERWPKDRYSTVREVSQALANVSTRDSIAHEETAQSALPQRASLPSISALGSGPINTAILRAVAVLPFRRATPDADETLADGFVEDLADQLAMSGVLRVRPVDGLAHLKTTTREARELGQELGVDVVIAGSFRRAGDVVRITLRAVSVGDGFQLWTQRFERPASEVFALADEAARSVADVLTPKDTRPRAPTNPEALELYFRARHEYHQFEVAAVDAQLPPLRAIATKSAELFEEARKLADDDPMILTGLALARARTWFLDEAGARERSIEAATMAIAVAPTRGESYVGRATAAFQRGDLPAAITDAQYALSLNATLADAHELLGRILAELGPAELALHHLRSAARLDPGFRGTIGQVLRVLELSGDHVEADRVIGEIIAKSDGVGLTQVARVVLWRGDAARAQELLEHPVIKAGKAPSARELLRALVDPASAPSPVKLVTASLGVVGASFRMRIFVSQARAEIAAAKGKHDAAFAALDDAAAAGLVDRLWIDRCAPLRGLRDDPRFERARAVVEERAHLADSALQRFVTPPGASGRA